MRGSLDKPILIVEDSEEDFEALRRFFSKYQVINPIHHCGDGDEALDFLYREGDYEELLHQPYPALILLDLNLPGTDGREVLAEIKGNLHLRLLPIIIFTTSDNPKDVQSCYAMGANAFLTKPVGTGNLKEILEVFIKLWLEVIILPQTEECFQS